VKEKQHWNWLTSQLQQWTSQGIINQQQADQILA
jgi:hypothetical protein